MKYLILIALAFAGCSPGDYHQYKLMNGDVISCRYEDQTQCGLSLWSCATDPTGTKNSSKFLCLTGVQKLD